MQDWKESKNELPILGEVVEVLGPKNWFYSKLERDYFALVEINDKLTWISPSLTDMSYKELEITHWRNIPADPKGRKPFVKITKRKGCWFSKVVFEKNKLKE